MSSSPSPAAPPHQPSHGEFVAMIALLVSLVALSIDAMLPALPRIGADLGVTDANRTQQVITTLMVGMAFGQLLYGPISDSTGRKPMVFSGLVVFAVGCLLSLFAQTFTTMLVGRFLQGLGVAGPRSVSMALIRDLYAGRAMAEIMSTIMSVFILVPILAPFLGQAVLAVADWRAIFAVFLLLGVGVATWFALRQPETLTPAKRHPLSFAELGRSAGVVLRQRCAMGFTAAAGVSSGAFIGYLSSSQQIFVGIYGVGDLFALYFGMVAASIGVAALVNRRLVSRHGMFHLTRRALQAISVLSLAYLAVTLAHAGIPPFVTLMLYLLAAFFFVGIVFGNINALAMETLGDVAGVGAALVASLSLAIAVALGGAIGQMLDGTLVPFVGGYSVLSVTALGILHWAERGRPESRTSTVVAGVVEEQG